jgi:hypothetical protein
VTTTSLKPIPTPYGGVRFRSRLEARWALFFDRLHIPWEYEPQGFDIGDGDAYLPDFLLGMGRLVWAEVKPSVSADPGGVARWRKFMCAQPFLTPGYLLTAPTGDAGQIFTVATCNGSGVLAELGEPWSICPDGYHFELHARGSLDCCAQCGNTAPCGSCDGSGLHKGGPVICYSCNPPGSGRVPASSAPWDSDSRIGKAFSAARSARFDGAS